MPDKLNIHNKWQHTDTSIWWLHDVKQSCSSLDRSLQLCLQQSHCLINHTNTLYFTICLYKQCAVFARQGEPLTMMVCEGNFCLTSLTKCTKCSEYPFATSTQTYCIWGTAAKIAASLSKSFSPVPVLTATLWRQTERDTDRKRESDLQSRITV